MNSSVFRGRAWQREAGKREPKRAAIHSFGFGGVNAHLLLEEYMAAEAALVN